MEFINISPHLRLKGVSPVNELGAERLFLVFPVETSPASFSPCSGMLLAGRKIGKSEDIELSGVVSSNCIISSLKKLINK